MSDGGLRDVKEVEALGDFQYFCPGLVVSHGQPVILEVGVEVELHGLPIAPGDILHGDANGLLDRPGCDRRPGAGRPARRCAPTSVRCSIVIRDRRFSLERLEARRLRH